MGVPWASSAQGAKAAILGVPFDCGTHAFRIGSRDGPRSIREQSRLVRAFESERADYDVRAALKLVDCGDVDVTPSRIEVAFERIEEAAWRIASDGATVVGLRRRRLDLRPAGARRFAQVAEPVCASRR